MTAVLTMGCRQLLFNQQPLHDEVVFYCAATTFSISTLSRRTLILKTLGRRTFVIMAYSRRKLILTTLIRSKFIIMAYSRRTIILTTLGRRTFTIMAYSRTKINNKLTYEKCCSAKCRSVGCQGTAF